MAKTVDVMQQLQEAVQKAQTVAEAAQRELEKVRAERAREKAQPAASEGTTGWTVTVNTELLAQFKDAAMDARKHYYEAAEEAMQLWLSSRRAKRSAPGS